MITDSKWYVLYTKSRAEKKLKFALDQLKIPNFLPLISQKKKWSDRYRVVDVPMFSGYIFVKIHYQQDSIKVLKEPNSVGFVSFQGHPATISEEDIELIRLFLKEYPDRVRIQEESIFKKGNMVEIVGGPFAGKKAIIEKIKNAYCIIVRIPSINKNIYIEVSKEDIGNTHV